jgi:hypothetical protein
MSRTYAKILDAIERNSYDVYTTRAHVPFAKKFVTAIGALAGTRQHQQTEEREHLVLPTIPAEQQ